MCGLIERIRAISSSVLPRAFQRRQLASRGGKRIFFSSSSTPQERNAALRAYIRVISLPSGLPEPARLAKFQKAMPLAARDEERLLVLERVGDLKHIETLRFLTTQLDKPTLANRAGTTICDLARERGLRDRNKADFENALNAVIAICRDQTVVDRAKRRLAEK